MRRRCPPAPEARGRLRTFIPGVSQGVARWRQVLALPGLVLGREIVVCPLFVSILHGWMVSSALDLRKNYVERQTTMKRELAGLAVPPSRQPSRRRAFVSQRGEGMTEYIIIIMVMLFCSVLLFFNSLVSAGNILVTWSGCLFCDEDAVANADAGLVDEVPVTSNLPDSGADDFDFGDDLFADAGPVGATADVWDFWWDDSFATMWDWMDWTDDGFYGVG